MNCRICHALLMSAIVIGAYNKKVCHYRCASLFCSERGNLIVKEVK